MTCLPATVTDPIATVIACATAYGGANWPALALTGLATVVVVALLACCVGFVVGWVGRA